jgi:septal ring factor EnvC (AmiA/AmiB activator)
LKDLRKEIKDIEDQLIKFEKESEAKDDKMDHFLKTGI